MIVSNVVVRMNKRGLNAIAVKFKVHRLSLSPYINVVKIVFHSQYAKGMKD